MLKMFKTSKSEQIRDLLLAMDDKGDPKYSCYYNRWSQDNPEQSTELKRLIKEKDWAERRIETYLSDLLEKADAGEDEENPPSTVR